MTRALSSSAVLLLLSAVVLAAPVPVANGDFEQGLEGWVLAKPSGFAHGEARLETADVHGGKTAVRIVNEEGAKTMVGLYTARPIALPDDCRTFALTAWMKGETLPEMVELRVASTGRDGQTLAPWQEHGWRFFRPPLEPHRGGWHQIRCEFGAQPDWGGFQLTFWVNGPKANVVVDDIAVETLDPQALRIPQAGQRLPDPAPGTALWWERPEVKVYPGEQPPATRGTALELAACGGEYECLQVCVRPDRELAGVSATCGALQGPGTLPAGTLRVNFVGWVEVSQALDGRSILGPTPDPLLTETTRALPAGRTSVLWLTVKVPPGTQAGDYTGRVELRGEGLQANLPVKLHVYGFDLPAQPTLRTIARVWKRHEGYEDLFLRNLQEHRCAGGWFPSGIKTTAVPGQTALQVDTSGFAPAVSKYLRPYGFRIFNIPAVFLGDASGLYNKEGKWNGLKIGSPEFDAAFSDYCRRVGDAVQAEGLMPQAIWQIWDEPQGEMVEQCAKLARLVKQAQPQARIYLTTGVQESLLDLVDIWCLPWPSTYRSDMAAKVLARGGELFAYQNSLYSLDRADSSLLLRSFPWRLCKYGVTGVEWWAISDWKSDPWTVPNQYAPQNGGGFFIYPTPDRKGAPLDSIRWELYREGVEDYDLLTMLGREQDAALKTLGCRDARLGGEAQRQELVGRVALDTVDVVRTATAADAARREACRRIEFLRADPAATVGWATAQGQRALLVAAARGASVTVNGKAVKGPLAQVPAPAGQAMTVTVKAGGKSKTVAVP